MSSARMENTRAHRSGARRTGAARSLRWRRTPAGAVRRTLYFCWNVEASATAQGVVMLSFAAPVVHAITKSGGSIRSFVYNETNSRFPHRIDVVESWDTK